MFGSSLYFRNKAIFTIATRILPQHITSLYFQNLLRVVAFFFVQPFVMSSPLYGSLLSDPDPLAVPSKRPGPALRPGATAPMRDPQGRCGSTSTVEYTVGTSPLCVSKHIEHNRPSVILDKSSGPGIPVFEPVPFFNFFKTGPRSGKIKPHPWPLFYPKRAFLKDRGSGPGSCRARSRWF